MANLAAPLAFCKGGNERLSLAAADRRAGEALKGHGSLADNLLAVVSVSEEEPENSFVLREGANIFQLVDVVFHEGPFE